MHKDEETGQRFVDFPISTKPERGEPRLLAISVDVALGATVTFDSYSDKSVYGWYNKQSKKYEENTLYYSNGIGITHLMASASIPIFYDVCKKLVRQKKNRQSYASNNLCIFTILYILFKSLN